MKTQDFMDKTNSFFGTFNSWVVSTMGLHIGFFKNYQKNGFTTHFEQKNLVVLVPSQNWTNLVFPKSL
jgi:hypothetical protein